MGIDKKLISLGVFKIAFRSYFGYDMTQCSMQKGIIYQQIHDLNKDCVIIALNLDSTMVKVVWSQKSVLKSQFSLSHSTLHYAPCTMHHAWQLFGLESQPPTPFPG